MSKSSVKVGTKEPKQKPAGNKQTAANSKTAVLLKALRRKAGASVPEMQKLTGWQAHSVRGFLSGTVKRRLGYSVTASVDDKRGRCYRIDTEGQS
jgi:hypothetical protein